MNVLAYIFKPLIYSMSALSLLSLGALWPAYATSNPDATLNVHPIVVSLALRPVAHFNQQIEQAARQGDNWSQHPKLIAEHFAGKAFMPIELTIASPIKPKKAAKTTSQTAAHHQTRQQTSTVKSEQYYLLSRNEANGAQLLLIVTLQQLNQGWQLQTAALSWRCQPHGVFATTPCKHS
ncbi:MAG: hypothetical protein ACRCT7_19465 [Shewanella sp.]